MSQHLTLATATGLPLLSLAFHVAVGMIGLTAGLVAIAARKGGVWHRRSGLVFVVTMIATGLTAVGISAYEGKPIGAGAFTAYFIFTAFTAVRPLPLGRWANIGLMAVAFTFAAGSYNDAFTALGRAGNSLNGVPAGMLFFLGTVALLSGIGDLRIIRAGGIQGTRRIVRHLWRMCFGLFIASGSFSAQLLRLMPPQLNSMPMVLLLGGGPLGVLLYWMWRIRLRKDLRGLMTAAPIEATRAV